MGSSDGIKTRPLAVFYADCHCGKVAATSQVSAGKMPPGNAIIDVSHLNKQQNTLTFIHAYELSVMSLDAPESGSGSFSYPCAFDHLSPAIATVSFLLHELLFLDFASYFTFLSFGIFLLIDIQGITSIFCSQIKSLNSSFSFQPLFLVLLSVTPMGKEFKIHLWLPFV